MKSEPGLKLYVCPFCGEPYLHDEAYQHGTFGKCQDRERADEKKRNEPCR